MTEPFNAVGGLANRLRAIFSRYEPGMRVVWTRTWDIAFAHFLEVFEPIDGLTFVDHPGGRLDDSFAPAAPGDDWHRHYALLRPAPSLRSRIAQT
ncbi:MAG TPA: hypothetical protein VGG39_30425 [Polyangiaceae bacterium]|jgi:hypothetical protein